MLELGRDANWLHRETKIPISTLYELMNGRQKSSTQLPAIAAKLGLRAVWLQKETGPRLLADPDAGPRPDPPWRFSFDPKRIDRLHDKDFAVIDAAICAMLNAIEGDGSAASKAKKG